MMKHCISAGVALLLAWSGDALGQGGLGSPVRSEPGYAPTNTVVVHENGRSTRCRVLEAWQLADGRVAHLVEAMDRPEKITLLTESAPASDLSGNAKQMPIRIFLWGIGRNTPPEGSPVPPQMRTSRVQTDIPYRSVSNSSPATGLPDITMRDLVNAMPGDGRVSMAEAAAAKIMVDETQSKARQAAVRFLATADFNYYPEAEAGLIAALRCDRVESVRLDAAIALGNCRGLSLKMLEALNLTALSLELDGNPAESSERVRNAARASLSRCMSRGLCLPPLEPNSPILNWTEPSMLQPAVLQPVSYMPTTSAVSSAAAAKLERERAESVSAQPRSAAATPPAQKGARSVLQLLQGSGTGRDSAVRPASTNSDARMRGLTPLGTDDALSLPSPPANRGVLAPIFQYNHQQ